MSRTERLLTAATSKNWRYWPFQHENHNVVITWISVATQSFAENIWSNTVIVAWIKKVRVRPGTKGMLVPCLAPAAS